MAIKIGIVGHGFVGKQVEKLIKGYYNYCIYEPKNFAPTIEQIDSIRINSGNINNQSYDEAIERIKCFPSSKFGKETINKICNLSIVCVPTPMAEDGSCDTSIVEETIKWLKTPYILIKSTIAPGTTDYLKKKYGKRIVFSPEYTGMSTYYNPIMKTMKEEPFVVFGGSKEDTQFMVDVWQPMLGPLCQYLQVDAIEAELAKYIENSFFAAKVAYCNEFFEICKVFGVEYDRVRDIWLHDPRINPMHTSVFKNNRGVGGRCLPKDTMALIKASEAKGYEPKILKQVINSNEEFKNKAVKQPESTDATWIFGTTFASPSSTLGGTSTNITFYKP